MEQQGEIILYQPDEAIKLEVRLENETVWLTQTQIVELFQSSKANISEHIKNIYEQKELEEISTVRDFRTVRLEGKRQVVRNLTYYNLDAIISIGFRVNSKRGILFRQWANKVLKDYLLKGYSINQRLNDIEQRMDSKLVQHEQRLNDINQKIDFFVRTSLPPVEGIFYNGQIFDAYKFATDLIKSARQSLVLIDNYADESVLLMLSKRIGSVSATIYTQRITQQLQLDLNKHNSQYPPIDIRIYRDSHDRFLIVDEVDVYHIGASLKDLGKKMFAFSKLGIPATAITNLL
ncbi:RhuM family protein [Parabacteroides sp.]